MSRFPTIVAHRGLHRSVGLPENSLPAFEAAWGSGVTWCECDVRVTRDKRVVIVHDETLERTSTGTGRVDLEWYESLARERLRDRTDGRGAWGVPLLTDMLHAMPAGCGMLIEMKAAMPSFHHVARAMISRGWKVGVQSFDPQNLVEMCAAGLSRRTFLFADTRAGIEQAPGLGCAGVNVHHKLVDRKLVDQLNANGLSVGTWTVNDSRDMERVIDAGVDMLITDEPIVAQRLIEGLRDA